MRKNKDQSLQRTKLLRTWILKMTTAAGSGHPTSSLSGVELMDTLFFHENGFFKYDIENPENPANDRLIFSKGHASPLFYALWAMALEVKSQKSKVKSQKFVWSKAMEELMTFRDFASNLEGHPMRRFPFTEVPTGSLGQGLGIGVGECLALRWQIKHSDSSLDSGTEKIHLISNSPNSSNENSKSQVQSPKPKIPKVYVLLGDSELAEGSVWEAAGLAAYYTVGNLVAIVDMNRLGQRGETMVGWDGETYAKRFEAFGWKAIEVDGHREEAIAAAYEMALQSKEIPTVIIAKTVKGKGVSFLENKNGWHGKALSEEELEKALKEIGEVDENIREKIQNPTCLPVGKESKIPNPLSDTKYEIPNTKYAIGDRIAPRKVYGQALIALAEKYPNLVALDAEVGNSTYVTDFAEKYPDRFYEMYIAEQNMVSTAVGMSRRGLLPFCSTFGAFFTRAFDQLRMAQYAKVPLVCVGSHVGVSIGEDGASQMGLEDIAMFRSLLESIVLYPSDAVSMTGCMKIAADSYCDGSTATRLNRAEGGIVYIRTTRMDMPVLYDENEEFEIGGSKTVRSSENDTVTVVAAGVTLHEALEAYDMLQKEGISIRVIDAYSVKPIDEAAIKKALEETDGIITVEDHYPEGGLGAAVLQIIGNRLQVTENAQLKFASLTVNKIPKSGTPEELLHYEEIDAEAIVKKVKELI